MTKPATPPSETKEFDEAVNGFFGVAEKILESLQPGSKGGKKITLDELLHSVTDGQVRQSIQEFWDAIQKLLKGGKLDVFDLLTTAGEAIMDLVGTMVDAFADGRLSPDEIVNGVTDGHIRDELLAAIEGIERVPAELTALSPLKMVRQFQRITSRLQQLREKMPAVA